MAIIAPDDNYTMWDLWLRIYKKTGDAIADRKITRRGSLSYTLVDYSGATSKFAEITGSYSGEYLLTETQLSRYERIGSFVTYANAFVDKVFDNGTIAKASITLNESLKGIRKDNGNIENIGRVISSMITDVKAGVADDGTQIMNGVYQTNNSFTSFSFAGGRKRQSGISGNLDLSIEGNLNVFATEKELNTWLVVGDIEEKKKSYVLSSNSYKSLNPLGENAEYLNHTKTYLEVPESSSGRICGYVQDITNNTNFDILLKWDSGIDSNASGIYQQINATFSPANSMSEILNPYHKYSNIRYMANRYIFGKILPETNIPIFASVGDADDYIGGGNPTPIYDGGGGGSEDNETGTEEKETELNETSENQPVLSSVYVCDRSALQSFAEVLYSTSTDIVNSITDGLKRYGENPINFVVDCFYVPFNVASFITQESVTQVPFGSYNADISGNIKKVTHNKTLLTIADFVFQSAYNDFRDYDYNYYLYLPYIGISAIDVEQFLNKNIQIKTFFDIRTGNIKYYIFANQKMIKTFEGNIRVSMPLTGSDKAAQASQYINGAESVLGGAFNTGFNIGGAVASGGASLATGMGGIGSGISSIINGAIDLTKSAPKQVSGNHSPSTAIKDTIYPYLIIERPSYSTDSATIRNQFNKPDYNYRIVENCKGFVKFADFNLVSDCNADEYNEIIKLLTIGIYV